MKTLLLLCLLIFLCAFDPVSVGPVKFTWQLAVALLAGIYEVVIRVIPTVANYSLLGKIIDLLKWLSEFFNRKK